jgi:hypothetical protein
MAAGVSLDRAIEAVGHRLRGGTSTKEVVRGLRALGVPCADRLHVVSRARHILPKRAILVLHRPLGSKRPAHWHWILLWDGTIYDPGGRWPDYPGSRTTSYLTLCP